MSENPNFILKPIGDLKDHHFFIPDYQRGYKWDVQQVLDLLEDLKEFEQVDDSFYCLQPLAVKQRTDEAFVKKHYANQSHTDKIYEVIDGQQRLTTVHIILQLISEPIYSIKYGTRKRSAKLLREINTAAFFENYKVPFTKDIGVLKAAINEEWAKYIKGKDNDFDNIDFYYFFTAYLTIKAWFVFKQSEIDKKEFSDKIKEQVQFVWYNETHEQNAKEVFQNLNSGKIPLTNAELIKALFVNSLKVDNKDIQQLQQTAFAVEWNLIETTLQDDDFWYFISNTNANKYATRIDFLFELIYKRPEGNEDKIYTYRQYADLVKKHGQLKPEDWNVIKSLFLKLREWYEDNELYHLIGYLTASWNKLEPLVRIREIVKVGQGEEETGKIKQPKGKAAFKKYLIDTIRSKVFINNNVSKAFDIKPINYDDNKALLNRILLLHNIETYQKSVVGFRFPFYDFKYRIKNGKLVKNVWSLEHIHAQQSDKVKTVEELKAWIGNEEDIQLIIKEVESEINDTDEYNKLKTNADELIESYKKQKETDVITETQKNLLSSIESALKMHQIWNMVLLEKDTNSSLGKKSFKKKRKEIITKVRQVTKDEAFIPLCTRNVFLKVYTKDLKQMSYWSYQDRKGYLEDIETKLAIYIQPENT